MITQEILGYTLEVINIEDFKDYYYKNKDLLIGVPFNSFMKAVDIPPKFFKEQPEETQEELIENRDTFVRENQKYFNKVIVVLKNGLGEILNACRMDRNAELRSFEKLKDIEDVENKFEHRSFYKDGYLSLIVPDSEIVKNEENNVLAVDFPILMNKPIVVHKAKYTLPSENASIPVDHVQYLFSEEEPVSDNGSSYSSIKEMIDSCKLVTNTNSQEEPNSILREPEVVSLALVEDNFIPKSQKDKIGKYIENNIQDSVLTTEKLEKLVLDFDETVKGYKQVTNLRSVNGNTVLETLNSDTFKELIDELEPELDAV